MKHKLFYIMMGIHNPDMKKGLDDVFDCCHFDWTEKNRNSNTMQHELIAAFNNFRPQTVFMHIQNGDTLHIDTIKKMAETAVVLNWTGDVRKEIPRWMVDISSAIYSTLFTNMNDVDTCKARGMNADFLQVGFDAQHFTPFGKTDNRYPEILFLGSHYPHHPFPLTQFRYDMVRALQYEFKERFGVYGGGWNGLERGNIESYNEEGKAYRSCKIAINLSHFNYRKYSSDRLFRILGSGAFCLTHNYPEIEADFTLNKDLVVWNNIDDLVNKINKYLVIDAERERIAINGCFNARTNFTWFHFAKNLEKLILKIYG